MSKGGRVRRRMIRRGVPGLIWLVCLGCPVIHNPALGAQARQPAPDPQASTARVSAASQTAPASKAEQANKAESAAAVPAQTAKPPLTPAEQRKEQIATDTARLQQLAAELKIEMDKSSKDTLSLTVVRKAAEIEKLAHKVRDEIRASLAD